MLFFSTLTCLCLLSMTSQQAINHPIFWNLKHRLNFVCTVSDVVQSIATNSPRSLAFTSVDPNGTTQPPPVNPQFYLLDQFQQMTAELLSPTVLHAQIPAPSPSPTPADWTALINPIIYKQRSNIDGTSIQSLVRLIRNLKHHIWDQEQEVAMIFESKEGRSDDIEEGLAEYFFAAFPKLFVLMYNYTKKHLRHKPQLASYFM